MKQGSIAALCTTLTAIALLNGCIPVRYDATLSGSEFGSIATPLEGGEGIVVLGWNGTKDIAVRGRTGARYDDGMAACVRNAIADASPQTRVVALREFRASAAGIFAMPDVILTEDAIVAGLRSAAASTTFPGSKIRYLFMVEGATEKADFHMSGGGYAAQSSNSRHTHIEVTAWDVLSARKLASFTTRADGFENASSIGLIINVLEYTPTESTACKDAARKIVGFLSLPSKPR